MDSSNQVTKTPVLCSTCKTFHGFHPFPELSAEDDCRFRTLAACKKCGGEVMSMSLINSGMCHFCEAGQDRFSSSFRRVISIEMTSTAKTIIEGENCGMIECSCGRQYVYSSRFNMHMVEWNGFILPCCPQCKKTPQSDSRRMDL